MKADVVVAGGGSAGVAAAVAAARCGAEVVLIERGGWLGGMGTMALVHTFCGLFHPVDGGEARVANAGLPVELMERLRAAGGAGELRRMGRVWVLPHDPTTLAAVLEDWAGSVPGLRCLMNAELTGARVEGGRLREVEACSEAGRWRVEAGAFVDATGDASLTVLSGGAWESAGSERLLRPAYIAELEGVPGECLSDEGRLRLGHTLMRGVREGTLGLAAMGCAVRGGIREGRAFATLDLEGADELGGWRPLDEGCVAEAERTGRATLEAVVAEWRGRHAGMEEVRVLNWPRRLGVRESRRGVGVHQLRGEEVLNSARFADAVAVAAWPLEFRENARGPRLVYPESGEAAEIPLRCLRHRDVDNLWLAGRCLSADHEAAASIRVMGTCLATGQAAGAAAALIAAGGSADWNGLAERVRLSMGGPML
jgi:2-polyprenyl-6-methoxyphenol hydroxylase-like FAD-dependent oxidoreductase